MNAVLTRALALTWFCLAGALSAKAGVAPPVQRAPLALPSPAATAITELVGAMQIETSYGVEIESLLFAPIPRNSPGPNLQSNWIAVQDVSVSPPEGNPDRPLLLGNLYNAKGQQESTVVTITKAVDRGSPQLQQAALSAQSLLRVVIDVYRPGSSSVVVRHIELRQVVVSVQAMGAALDGKTQLEKVTFKGKKMPG